MREIKFRAWVKDTYYLESEFMLLWEELKGIGHDEIMLKSEWNVEGKGWFDTYSRKNVELMQYTGLKDMQGQEIYEGDIVNVWRQGVHRRFKVIWRDAGVPMYILYPQPIDEIGMWNLRSDMSKSIEVIGNTYENPELLEVAK